MTLLREITFQPGRWWVPPSETERTASCCGRTSPRGSRPRWKCRNYEISGWHPLETRPAVCTCRSYFSSNFNIWLIFYETHIPSFNFFLMVEISMGALIIFLYVGNCLVLTGVRNGQASSWPPSSERRVWHTDRSLSVLLVRAGFFLLGLAQSAAMSFSSTREFSRETVGVGAVVSSWTGLNIWLGLLNFFLAGVLPEQAGQYHFPRGVWGEKIIIV